MAARQSNPRKFSDKIALMNQRQEAKTSEFQAIMKEVSMVKPVPRSRRGNTLMPRHPYPGHQLSRSCPDNEGGGIDSIYAAGANLQNDSFVKDRGGGGAIRNRSRENRSPSPYNRDVSPHSFYRTHSPNSTSCSPHSRYSTSPHSPSVDYTGSSQVILLPRKSSPTSNYLCPPSTTDIRRSSSESNIDNVRTSSSESNINNIPWEPPSYTGEPPYTGFQLPTQNIESSNLQFTCPVNLLPREQHVGVFSDHSKEAASNTQTVSSSVSSVTGDSSPTIIITSCDNESRNLLHMNRSVITVNKNHKRQQDTDYRAPFSPASPGTPESLNDYSSQNSPVETASNSSQHSSNPSQYTSNNQQQSSSPVHNQQHSISPTQYPSSPVHNQYPSSSPVHNQQHSTSPTQYPSSPVPNQYPPSSPVPNQYPSSSPVPNQYPSSSRVPNQYPSSSPVPNQYPSSSPIPNHPDSTSPTHYTYQSDTGTTSTSSLSQAVNTIHLNSRVEDMENIENMGTTDSISLDDWMKLNLATINQVLINNDKDVARRKDSDEVCQIMQSTKKSDELFEPIATETIDEEFIANLLSG